MTNKEKEESLRLIHVALADYCGKVASMFKPEVKVTILARNPNTTDGDCVVSDDDMDLAAAALQNLKRRDARNLSLTDFIG